MARIFLIRSLEISKLRVAQKHPVRALRRSILFTIHGCCGRPTPAGDIWRLSEKGRRVGTRRAQDPQRSTVPAYTEEHPPLVTLLRRQ